MLFSAAGMSLLISVGSGTPASMASVGHPTLIQMPLIPSTSTLMPLASLRQTATAIGLVSPSVALVLYEI